MPAYVVTDNSNDTQLAPNEVALTNNLNNATTTLTLSSVPEPSMYALLGAVMVGGLLYVTMPAETEEPPKVKPRDPKL